MWAGLGAMEEEDGGPGKSETRNGKTSLEAEARRRHSREENTGNFADWSIRRVLAPLRKLLSCDNPKSHRVTASVSPKSPRVNATITPKSPRVNASVIPRCSKMHASFSP